VPDQSVSSRFFLTGIQPDADLNKDVMSRLRNWALHLQTKWSTTPGEDSTLSTERSTIPSGQGDFIFITISSRSRSAPGRKPKRRGRRAKRRRSRGVEDPSGGKEEECGAPGANENRSGAKAKADEAERRSFSEQRALEEKSRRAEEERSINKAKTDEQLKAVEAERRPWKRNSEGGCGEEGPRRGVEASQG